jgi:hypothetical protein
MDWETLTNAELLALSGGALAELRGRGVVRTANAPAGDLAERLVADAMGGELAHNSQKVSAFRSWDCESVMFVLFDPMYRVRAAALVPSAVVREHSSHVEFTASDRVFASDSMLALCEDWTGRLQTAALWEETRKRTSGFTVKEVSGPTPAGGVRAVAIIQCGRADSRDHRVRRRRTGHPAHARPARLAILCDFMA